MYRKKKNTDSKRLFAIEKNSERILAGIAEIKREIAKLPTNLDYLINSLEKSAKAMHQQSICHRQSIEKRRTIFICHKK